MRIASGQAINGTSGTNKRSRSSGSGRFTLESEAEETRAGGVGGFSPIGSLDAVLALQELNPDEGRQRAAAEHGRDILDDLDALKIDLLSGKSNPATLERLAERIKKRADHSDDPALKHILAEIELRAQVELAKRGKTVNL